MSEIRYARKSDLEILKTLDHISHEELEYIIERRRIIVMTAGESIIGWLRYGLFWDNTPFMNMLYFLDGARRKGNGTRLVSFWESEMRALGYDTVMTSTLAGSAEIFPRREVLREISDTAVQSKRRDDRP